MGSLRFRPAGPEDAVALSRLLGQLGYPTESGEIPGRLERLHARAGTMVVLVESAGEVVGAATVHLFDTLHASGPTAWLTSVVVEEKSRGKGIGAALIEHAEQWAVERGANRISLTSALHRTRAQKFYQDRDYEQTGIRLTKVFDHRPAGRG